MGFWHLKEKDVISSSGFGSHWPLVLTSRMAANLPKITWNFYVNDGGVILESSADKCQCLRSASCICFHEQNWFRNIGELGVRLVAECFFNASEGCFNRTLEKWEAWDFYEIKILCKEQKSLGKKNPKWWEGIESLIQKHAAFSHKWRKNNPS